jgi:hypothetical protein
MRNLRERMQEDLQLRGLSPKTQESYLRAVRQLAEYCQKPPDEINEEALRRYFLYLTDQVLLRTYHSEGLANLEVGAASQRAEITGGSQY